jgi:hypothetical protein
MNNNKNAILFFIYLIFKFYQLFNYLNIDKLNVKSLQLIINFIVLKRKLRIHSTVNQWIILAH